MERKVPVLIVSCRLENRKLLTKLFEGLPIDTYCVSSLRQAKETLHSRQFSVIFCEERLSDGPYRDLLEDVRTLPSHTRFVVMLCTGEWDEYLEAMRLGAEEVLRCPLQPTDVDLALIHAMRSSHQNILRLDEKAIGAVA
jgi:DNA-binding NtrC family response regulator